MSKHSKSGSGNPSQDDGKHRKDTPVSKELRGKISDDLRSGKRGDPSLEATYPER